MSHFVDYTVSLNVAWCRCVVPPFVLFSHFDSA